MLVAAQAPRPVSKHRGPVTKFHAAIHQPGVLRATGDTGVPRRDLRLHHRAGGHDDRGRGPPNRSGPLMDQGNSQPLREPSRTSASASAQAEETHKVTRQHAQRERTKPTKGTATNSLRASNTNPSMWVFGVLGRHSCSSRRTQAMCLISGPVWSGEVAVPQRAVQSRRPRLPAHSPTSSQNPRKPRDIRQPRPPAHPARDRIGTARHKHTGQHTQRRQSPP